MKKYCLQFQLQNCILTVVLPLVLQSDDVGFTGIESDNFCALIMLAKLFRDNEK